VYRGISPPLSRNCHSVWFEKFAFEKKVYLVIETTSLVEKVKKFGIRLAPPEVEVTNLKVTPD
jgi:hypothetical protein